jgi:DNA-binding NarL/FixJ family response regulator
LPVSPVTRQVNAHYHAKPNHNCGEQDSRFAAGFLKRGNQHADEDQLRQHTGDELCALQLTVVFETYTESFGVVRQVVAMVLKSPSGASGGTLRNVARCQLRHVALLSGPAPCDTARRRPWVRLRNPTVGCLPGQHRFSVLAAWNSRCLSARFGGSTARHWVVGAIMRVMAIDGEAGQPGSGRDGDVVALSGLRVVLAEDDVLLREGLASLLERSGFAVVGQAGDGPQLLALVREQAPELVVVDIRMPPTHTTEGLEAARVIRQELPTTGIVVLSAHAEIEHAMELLASGRGIGYLLKSRVTDVTEFVETLQRIAKGASVVDPALVAELVSARRRNDPLAVLSSREREVLALMAEGRSNAGIGRRLWVTEGTVEKHVRSILAKLRLPETDNDHRRVLAVVTFLEAR